VVNAATGEGVDAVINGRIRVSPDRIVDLSSDVWEKLGLTEGAIVLLVYIPTVSSPTNPTVEPQKVEPAPEKIELEEAKAELAGIKAELEETKSQLAAEKAKPAVEKTVEKNEYEILRLKTSQPLYHILILDRRNCEEDSDISDLQNFKMLYKFAHIKKGYLIAAYASSGEGPMFPIMPDNSLVIVNLTSTSLSFIRDYVDSAPFKKHISDPQLIAELLRALK